MKKLLLIFALAAWAQPQVGFIEIYGARKVPLDRVRRALAIVPGDPLPRSKADVEERLTALGGIVEARLEAFCCEQGKLVLYVGLAEKGALAFQVLPAPELDVSLPPEIAAVYTEFTGALMRAVENDDIAEDYTQGHGLMQNIACRNLQERFIGLAQLHEAKLRDVLRYSMYPEQRAIAAYVIGYVPDKKPVVADLQRALQDPDESTRNNASRAMRAIAILAAREPQREIRIQPTWYVEMLNSIVLADRLDATKTLLNFTGQNDQSLVAHLKERSLPALVEMANWRHLPHALPAFLLLGRVAGWEQSNLEEAWSGSEREKTVELLRKAALKTK